MLTAEKVDFFSRVEEPEPYFNRWGQSRPKVKAAVPETDMMKMLLKVGLNFLNQVPTRVMVLMQTENYFNFDSDSTCFTRFGSDSGSVPIFLPASVRKFEKNSANYYLNILSFGEIYTGNRNTAI